MKILDILAGSKKSSVKEIAEAYVELEKKEPKLKLAVDAASEEIIRLGQARLDGVEVSDKEISASRIRLEMAQMDLKAAQESKVKLEKLLNQKIDEDREDIESKILALRPAVLKEKERLKKELAERLVEAQVLFNCFRGETYATEILQRVDFLYTQDFPDGPEHPTAFLNMIAEAQEESKKRLATSVIGREAALKQQSLINISDPANKTDEIVRKLIEETRNKAQVVASSLSSSMN